MAQRRPGAPGTVAAGWAARHLLEAPAGAGGSGGGVNTEMNQTDASCRHEPGGGKTDSVQVGTPVWEMQRCEALRGVSCQVCPCLPILTYMHLEGWEEQEPCATSFSAGYRRPKPIAPSSPPPSPCATLTVPTAQRHVLGKLASVQTPPGSFPDTLPLPLLPSPPPPKELGMPRSPNTCVAV